MRMNLMTAEAIRARAPNAVMVLPLGATEQHGPHLGVSTDAAIATAIAEGVERALPEDVLLCPTLSVGSSHHHLGFGALSIAPETYARVLADLIDCLQRWGAQRIVLLNGHGGNIVPAKQALAELGARDALRALTVLATYWEMDQAFAGRPPMESPSMSHACEYETSMMLHILPDSVEMKRAGPAQHPAENPYIGWENEKPYRGVSTVVPFHLTTSTGNHGHPERATKEKGQALAGAAIRAVTAFISSFKTWPLLKGTWTK